MDSPLCQAEPLRIDARIGLAGQQELIFDTRLYMCHIKFMKKANALELRQSLGKVIAELEKTGKPILLEKGRKPVAVLISLQDFRERFVEKQASEERDAIVKEMYSLARKSSDSRPATEMLRELRNAK